VAGSSAIRGTRVGSGPVRWPERSEQVPRHDIVFWCLNGHQTALSFAANVEVPVSWDCPHCGMPASQDQANPPQRPRAEPYKTHLAYVKERRSDADGAALLDEALARLRQRRGGDD